MTSKKNIYCRQHENVHSLYSRYHGRKTMAVFSCKLQIKISSSFAKGSEVPVTEAALPRWMGTLRRWKRKAVERGSQSWRQSDGWWMLSLPLPAHTASRRQLQRSNMSPQAWYAWFPVFTIQLPFCRRRATNQRSGLFIPLYTKRRFQNFRSHPQRQP